MPLSLTLHEFYHDCWRFIFFSDLSRFVHFPCISGIQGVWRPDSGGVIQVAVKILESQGLVENPSDFLNEIAVMHRIDHPDIVHLYGVCMEPDSWRIVSNC